MGPTKEQWQALMQEVEELTRQQDNLQNRLADLRSALKLFEPKTTEEKPAQEIPVGDPPPAATPVLSERPLPEPSRPSPPPPLPMHPRNYPPAMPYPPLPPRKRWPGSFTTGKDLEKFIGEDLISKIGIVILVIGVGIGTKYAIDHDLISPLTRIL
ncbi:MAG TPA: hypothetical protein VK907_02635, partial [Phnomibacter sp.]|nr:hypothetical protein [Phnomibacter sp.]